MLFVLVLSVIFPMSATSSVIIVGAGPAGIAAATKLLEYNITNITVLEAENRIGGRINSVKFHGGIVDLGAQYCHGVEDNVAYQLAQKYNILEPGLRGLQNNVYYSNASKLDTDFVKELQEIYLSYHKTEGIDNYNVTGKALGELITHKYNTILQKKYEHDLNKVELVAAGLKFLEGYIVIHEGSFSWLDPSAECDYRMCPGNQGLIWKGLGYKAVLDIMMRTYPDTDSTLGLEEKIRFNTKVEKIRWNQTNSVQVFASNKIFSADYVIFTPSIGVLQGNKNLFDPPLPHSKQDAMESTGFGGVMKIFLYFSTKWWDDKDRAFSFFWSNKNLTQLETDKLWLTHFRYILKVPDNINVWVGWVSGPMVPKIERLPLEALKTGCEEVLNRFLGRKYNLSPVDDMMRSTWCSNENFGGTYSFTKTGRYRKDISHQEVLGTPLSGIRGSPVVLFAGEATNPVHYSTVHGAIETGFREAQRVLNLSKKHD